MLFMQPIKIHSDVIPFIKLQGHDIDIIGEVETALYKLEQLTTGKTLLNKLKKLTDNGRELTIHASRDFKNIVTPEISPLQIAKYRLNKVSPNQLSAMAYELCTKKSKGNKHDGVNANVYFNPMVARQVDGFGAPEPAPERFHFHNHFTLGHILIHAMRIMKGNYQGGVMDNMNLNNPIQQREELRAYGLAEFYRRPVSENKMREESGYPPYLTTGNGH